MQQRLISLKRRRKMTGVQINKDIIYAERQAILSAAIVSETDLQGKIIYVNDNFVKTFGYKKEEIIGKTHNILNSQFHSEEFFKDLWRTLKKGRIWRGMIRNVAKNGECIWLDSAIMPIFNKKGKPVKYMSIRFDVTPYLKN
ncbi:MAG: PAS domain-containing protein [Nanoarchaeota archaeon]|nr:PAS domain-containing protein [Nanoarchaeota archaeon]